MPLRWKIWLSVFGIVTGLFGVAGWILQRHAVETAFDAVRPLADADDLSL